MAALVNALDMSTPTQLGEKEHLEYGWSSDLREKIVQFSFQMTRVSSTEAIDSLANQLDNILRNVISSYKSNKILFAEYQEYIITAYKIIGHTRDVISGKGEYELAYMQIVVWYNYFPEMAIYALSKFVTFDNNEHPYGSWKDIKYFARYCKNKGLNTDHPLMQSAFSLINTQIKTDITASKKTLSGKWSPREGSNRFGWIFNELAYLYFSHYLETAKTPEQLFKAKNKCKMEFRKINSSHNKILDTVQIKQCADEWDAIDHSKTTSITLAKQKKAFLNITKDGIHQRSEKENRVQCAKNFKEYIQKGIDGEVKLKGRHLGMDQFVIEALHLIEQKYSYSDTLRDEINLLNQQWLDNSTYNTALGSVVAMVDTSGSMFNDTKAGYAAIGLGIRCAEKSVLGKRVLCFNDEADWSNLDDYDNFVDMVQHLKRESNWGTSTNFYAALDKILMAITKASPLIPYEDVSELVLAIFSDMQMDEATDKAINMDTLYNTMVTKYAETGMKMYGKPLKPPHILFWNMKSSNGFPVLSTQTNVSMLSGYSPALLNLFGEKGIDVLKTCTPWSQLMDMLGNDRYQCLEDYSKQCLV